MLDRTEITTTGKSTGRRRPQVRALCCECGQTRTTTTLGVRIADCGGADDGRCLIERKCKTCRRMTTHAYLRDAPDEQWCRDKAELSDEQLHEEMRWRVLRSSGWDMQPLATPRAVKAALQGLRDCGVRVRVSRGDWPDDAVGVVMQALDDASWHVVLPASLSDAEKLRVIDRVWRLLATRSDTENEGWYVRAADPDDPASYPMRCTTLVRPGRA